MRIFKLVFLRSLCIFKKILLRNKICQTKLILELTNRHWD